ncbi:MAG: T9SS type A sorting domain-containing protein [Bacteroidota bacterium]
MKKRRSGMCPYTHTYSPLRRLVLATFITMIMLPFMVKGQRNAVVNIIGSKTLCLTDTIAYTVEPIYEGVTYNWTIYPTNVGSIIMNNNSSIIVQWYQNNMSYYQPTFLIVTTEFGADTIKLWKCCNKPEGNEIVLSDDTITSLLPDTAYFFNGTIVINNNINASNSEIYMGQEAKIIVNPPYTFNINATMVRAGCGYMWDGIYVSNPLASVVTQNNSTIRDAFNAIVSENGAIVNSSNTFFQLNLKGIVIKNFSGSNPLSISNCRFYSTDDEAGIIPFNLHAPYSTRRSISGIEITNMSNVTVGNTALATKNKFSYLDFGINISTSNVNVYNNNFINLPATGANTGYGVKITGTSTSTYTVNIGGYNSGSTIYTNLFNNCVIGVLQQFQSNIKVICDTFTSNSLIATFIASNSTRNIDFTKNRIESSPYGLLINDFTNTRLVVDSNSLYNAATGIAVANATQQECYGATIRKNTITGTFTNGILLTNVKDRSVIPIGPPGYERQIPYIYGNTITLSGYNLGGSTIYSGIRVENGNNTYIEKNVVSTPSYAGTDLTQALRLNGIYVLASPKTNLCSNTLTRLGMGIRMSGLCTTSPIKSNTMNYNFYGVRLDAATIGNQGIVAPRWVNRNAWNYPFVAGRYRVQGSVAVATTWTYDNQLQNYTLLPGTPEYSVTGGFTATLISNPVPQGCGYDGIIWIPYVFGGNNAMVGGTISEGENVIQNFSLDSEENQYYQAANYFAATQNDNMAVSADAFSEVTDNPIQTTSIILFDRVNKLIAENRIDEAAETNNSIVPANLIERNQQTAYTIYLQSWAKGRFELTSDERTTLLDIANQQHIQGGYGVFTAWVMLYRSPQDQPVKPKSIIKSLGFQNNEITIYPNPAREQVTITGALDIAFAVIYDIQGRELLKTANTSSSSEFIINTSKLCKGVYFIKLVRSDLSDEKAEKLIIE